MSLNSALRRMKARTNRLLVGPLRVWAFFISQVFMATFENERRDALAAWKVDQAFGSNMQGLSDSQKRNITQFLCSLPSEALQKLVVIIHYSPKFPEGMKFEEIFGFRLPDIDRYIENHTYRGNRFDDLFHIITDAEGKSRLKKVANWSLGKSWDYNSTVEQARVAKKNRLETYFKDELQPRLEKVYEIVAPVPTRGVTKVWSSRRQRRKPASDRSKMIRVYNDYVSTYKTKRNEYLQKMGTNYGADATPLKEVQRLILANEHLRIPIRNLKEAFTRRLVRGRMKDTN